VGIALTVNFFKFGSYAMPNGEGIPFTNAVNNYYCGISVWASIISSRGMTFVMLCTGFSRPYPRIEYRFLDIPW
jgi:hypothetical protein